MCTLFALLLFMFFLPSSRFSLRPSVLGLLSLRSLLVSLWLLTSLLRLLFWPLTFLLRLLSCLLNLRLSLLPMLLHLRPLLILLLPLLP